MGNETTDQSRDLNEETRIIWNQKASFWDEKMGDGNDFQRLLTGPASERLLGLQEGEKVIEFACGNGVFTRRMAQMGAHVTATDFSETFLERARAYPSNFSGTIAYSHLDVTHENEIIALGMHRFDAAVCNMAIMDMAEIDPLMRGIRHVLKPGGRFVFSLTHPCFNNTGTSFCVEESLLHGEMITTYSVKTTRYLHARPEKGVGMVGEPMPHYYFDRPLHVILQSCFQAGLVLDGLEEPAFNHPHDGSKSDHLLSWRRYSEIPPVLVARMRPA